jgi:hypothetical protein
MNDSLNPNVFRIHVPTEALMRYCRESLSLAETISEKDVGSESPEELAKFILNYCFAKVPKLDLASMVPPRHSSVRGQIQWDFEVPFEGNSWWFSSVPPQTSVTEFPNANYSGQHGIHVQVTTGTAAPPDEQFEMEISKIELGLKRLQQLVDDRKAEIQPRVIEILSQRKVELEARNQLFARSKYGLKLRKDVPEAAKRPTIRLKATPTSKPAKVGIESDPVLGGEIFDHLVGLIESMGAVFELNPSKAFKNMTEEDFRFVLLLALNSHYEGQASAEAFTLHGRSDIRIVWKGASVFVAECKIWHGERELHRAIDQLEGYKRWRDTKAALIVFNRGGQLSAILAKADLVVRSRPNFMSIEKSPTSTTLRYRMRHVDDESKQYEFALIVLDVPKAVTRGKRGKSELSSIAEV